MLVGDLNMVKLKKKLLILIVANGSADVSADTTSALAFKNCLFLLKIQLITPQDIANE